MGYAFMGGGCGEKRMKMSIFSVISKVKARRRGRGVMGGRDMEQENGRSNLVLFPGFVVREFCSLLFRPLAV